MVKIQVDLMETDKMKVGRWGLKLLHLKEAPKPSAIPLFQVIWTKNFKMGAKIPLPASVSVSSQKIGLVPPWCRMVNGDKVFFYS